MPRLIIDDLAIEVPAGAKVIEAAERLGIMIPRFCYHKGLGSVGACRMCAVKFLQGPFKGVQMSCMVDAQDGMVVSTTDEEAVDFRKHVIEWLMMNHPHDCPVCDEGGHCLLQDMTVSGGHGMRRFPGKKRTYRDQYLGALVQHEMNRCIHCYRCVRFYQEFAGYRDLGVVQIAHKVYFGRFSDGPLESPFSGNLIDICPTGVYTDRPSRYRARRWDLERGPSLCIHCSLGCNIISGARYREVLRQEARLNEDVNGYFICDRGRYGFAYSSHLERPRRPRIGALEVEWKGALQAACERMAQYQPDSIACLGSMRSSIETMGMLQHLAKTMGWSGVDYFLYSAQRHKVKQAVSRLDKRLHVSMRDIELADCIIAAGVDPINEAPMLALAMRQACRAGAAVVVIDPRPVFLPFDFEHLPLPLEQLEACLAALVRSTVRREHAANYGEAALAFYDLLPSSYPFGAEHAAHTVEEQISRLAPRISNSKKPVIICGTDIVPETAPSLAADLALLLNEAKERAGVFYVLPGANSFGAALFDAVNGRSFEETLLAIENGTVRVLIVVENDPFWHFHDRARLERALEKLEFLLVLDYLPSEAVQRAHIFLPTRALFETGSSFINQEGRLQYAEQIHLPGTPIWQVSDKSHPPRTYGTGIPGGDPESAWQVLGALACGLDESENSISDQNLWQVIAKECSVFGDLKDGSLPRDVSILPANSGAPFFSNDFAFDRKRPMGDRRDLLLVDWTFGTEELASYSDTIRKVEPLPHLCMHPADADELGLAGEKQIQINLGSESLIVDLQLSEKMAPGTLVMPRHRRLGWQKLGILPRKIPVEAIKKVTEKSEEQ